METITASLRIDSKQAEQKLETVREKIARLEKDIGERKEKQADLNAEADRLSQEYQKALDKLEELKRLQNDNSISGFTSQGAGFEKEIAKQEKAVAAAEKNYGKARQAAEKYYDYTIKKEEDLKFAQEHAGQLVQQMQAASSPSAVIAEKTAEIKNNIGRIANRIKNLFRRVLFFSVIAKGIRMIRDYITDVIKVNPQAAEAIAKLKGALLTLAQPIVEIVVPILSKLINIITSVINKVASFIAMLQGKNLKTISNNAEALYKETSALKATGNAAKKASKELAAFDELNVIGGKDSGSSSSSGTDIAPVFDADYIFNSERFKKFIDMVEPYIDKLRKSIEHIGESIAKIKDNPNFPKLLDFLTKIAGFVASTILEIFADGLEAVADALDAINEALNGNWLEAFGKVLETDEDILETLLDPFEHLKKLIENLEIPDWLKKLVGINIDATANAMPGPLKWLIKLKDTIYAIKQLIKGDINLWQLITGQWDKSGLVSTSTKLFSGANVQGYASGTVVPPNREFLARLGDNKNETEVVSPLSTMKQAFLDAMRESGGGDRPVNIYLDGKLLATTTTKYQNQMAKARG